MDLEADVEEVVLGSSYIKNYAHHTKHSRCMQSSTSRLELKHWWNHKTAEAQRPLGDPTSTDEDISHHSKLETIIESNPSVFLPNVSPPKSDKLYSLGRRGQSYSPQPSSNSAFRPPQTIKDYKERPRQIPEDPSSYNGCLNAKSAVDFDDRNRVGDTSKPAGNEKNVMASFEEFLQEVKLCYAENCDFK